MVPFEKIVDQIRGVFNFGGSFGVPRLGPDPPAPKSVAPPLLLFVLFSIMFFSLCKCPLVKVKVIL